ncbi:MAG: alanine--glyoxylate aminotransferase family protein [Anaerolineae bacterium]|nr:alanine--glyoxylate aminotransferase family protein [Anaerolineae bacterium]
MTKQKHPFLFIPGPVNVRPDVLEAQAEAMIGHRSADFEALFAACEEKLKQLFFTNRRVYISASSGSGLQEAAIRNGVQQRVINFVGGAFADRWHQVSVGCGKEAIKIDVAWGQAVKPETVDVALQQHPNVEAITIVHNETSTGVASPLGEIAALMREKYPDTLIFVDAVSSFSGLKLPFDEWGLDVMLTSSQKALSIPPGLSFAAVSDRVLEKAKTVTGRGWYFDFLVMEKYLQRSTTAATPAISLMRALNLELDHILAEGLAARFARHQVLAERTRQWAAMRGFGMFSEAGYHSPTVSCLANTLEVDVGALNKFLRQREMIISNGYGNLKGKTFRIAHMGWLTMEDMDKLLSTIDEYLETTQ